MKKYYFVLVFMYFCILNTQSQSLIDDARAKKLIEQAGEALQTKSFELSKDYYEQADSLSPAAFTYADYNNMAGVYYNLRDFNKAVIVCKKSLSIDTTYVEAYFNLGIVYTALDSTKAAIAAYKKITEINPLKKEAYFNMGIAHSKLKEYESAISCYEKIIKIDKNDTKAYVNMGIAYAELGYPQKLVECFQQAAALGDKEAQEFLSKTGKTW